MPKEKSHVHTGSLIDLSCASSVVMIGNVPFAIVLIVAIWLYNESALLAILDPLCALACSQLPASEKLFLFVLTRHFPLLVGITLGMVTESDVFELYEMDYALPKERY